MFRARNPGHKFCPLHQRLCRMLRLEKEKQRGAGHARHSKHCKSLFEPKLSRSHRAARRSSGEQHGMEDFDGQKLTLYAMSGPVIAKTFSSGVAGSVWKITWLVLIR